MPAGELQSISDNIGLPLSYDLAFYQTDSIGPQDADVLIQLSPSISRPPVISRRFATCSRRDFPNVTAYFQAADIVSQVLNFGLPAAIDAQINGNDLQADYDIALRLEDRMRRIPGVTDLRIAEPQDYPTFKVNVDRDKALELGITQTQVTSSVLANALRRVAVAAQLLARPEKRRQLQRHRAVAAAPDRFRRARCRTFR